MTSEVRGMIMTDNFSADSIRKLALDSGMLTLVQHGLHFVDEGVTTHEEVLRVLGESS
jgi:type II secretory ATPase GspE/PulE/Tfp pilus assembly ATPase PilB-like protein